MVNGATSKVLVAEDDADLRQSMVALLELVGFRVVEADSLPAALRTVHSERVDLVLTDLFGDHSSSALTSIDPLLQAAAPTPVGVITAWSLPPAPLDAADRPRFMLKKPFNVELLVTEVAAAVQASQPPPADRLVQAVYAYFRALTARDWALLGEVVADDVVYELPGTTSFAQRVEGRERFLDFSKKTFEGFRDARFEEVRAYTLPVGLAARFQGSWEGTSGRTTQAGAVVFSFRGDRIAKVGVKLDDERLERALTAPS